jgi:hypothetical protein
MVLQVNQQSWHGYVDTYVPRRDTFLLYRHARFFISDIFLESLFHLSNDLVHMGTSDLVFENKLKFIFLSFKKHLKIYLHVANYLSQQRAKNLVQILCIVGYTKMTNV